MPSFEIPSSVDVQHLAMTLIHNLWQGAVIALALVGLLRLIPARKASLRYAACLAAMTLVLVCGLATWGWLNIRAGDATIDESLAAPASTAALSIWNWQLILVVVWLVGALFMLCRLARSFGQVHLLKQKSRDASAEVQSLVTQIAKRCGLHKPFRVLVNDTISSAAVVGILKPVLFVPASMITGLNLSQLEAVIAHEVAHIRRFDPVVNFCQSLIEAVLFFNPAVAWIGRQVRMEREACCDAFGVTATGDESLYLDTLALWAKKMKDQRSSAPVGAIAFADRQESTLLDRVRRVLFPDFVPATRFSPVSTVFLFAIGLVLFASLWQGTMLAVQVADELLSHEQVVAELTETRNEYEGKPVSLTELAGAPEPMTVKIKIETEDNQPTTCWVDTNYDNHDADGGSLSARGPSIKPGKTKCSFSVQQGWANVLVTGADYVPVTFFNVRPDKDGVANLVVPLRNGYPGEVQVVSESGEPIANATVQLVQGLAYKQRLKTSSNSETTISGGSGVYVDPLTTNADGVVAIKHATDQPMFQARVTAAGFQQYIGPHFGIKKGQPHKIVMKKALPVTGRITDAKGSPLANVKLHLLSYARKTANGYESRSGDVYLLNEKKFGKIVATTSEAGEFKIDMLKTGWTYSFIADAGDLGLATCKQIQPGDENVDIKITGPINISGTVTGAVERLKQGDRYVLPYRISLRISSNSLMGDRTGKVELTVVDGIGTFHLKNVIPGQFNFQYYGSESRYYDPKLRAVPVYKSIDDLKIVVPAEGAKGKNSTTVRRARLKFKSADGVAPFRGRVGVFSRVENHEHYSTRPMEVVDGVLEIDVNAPTRLTVELADAPGFVFDEGSPKTTLEIDATEGEYKADIDVFPAGAVIGQVTVAKRIEGERLSVFGEMRYELRDATTITGISDTCDKDGKFYLPNVPYGATFELMARQGVYCESISVADIDEANPIFKANVALGNGPALRGKVLDSEGKPFVNQTISLRVAIDGQYGFTALGRAITDQQGDFDFGPINPGLGEYKLWIKTEKKHASVVVDVTQTKTPLQIKLKKGLIIEGLLINDDTGKPIANEEVYAITPSIRQGTIYAYEAEGETDANGAFRFSNLNNEEYQFNTRIVHGRVIDNELVPAGERDLEVRVTTKPE